MNSESSLVMEIWELMRDALPAARRQEVAISMLRSFEEFGIEGEDLHDLLDEDEHLTSAHRIVFSGHDEDEEEENYGDEEDDYYE